MIMRMNSLTLGSVLLPLTVAAFITTSSPHPCRFHHTTLSPPRQSPSWRSCTTSLGAAKKGFGVKSKPKPSSTSSSSSRSGCRGDPLIVKLDDDVQIALDALDTAAGGIETYLNPALFADPETMRGVGKRLRAGEVVVLRDAFREEFAQVCVCIFLSWIILRVCTHHVLRMRAHECVCVCCKARPLFT